MGRKSDDSNVDAALWSAREEVVEALPFIVRKLIEKAKEGSHQHAKFLFDFAGSGPADGVMRSADDDSLAALLMKELKEPSS
jgi:hypothetical protein